ncbi:MAG: DUF5719 family protein [Ornithinibacter sp.]
MRRPHLRALSAVNLWGVARVVAVAGAAFGLVHLATNGSVQLDLASAAGEQQGTIVGTALATRVSQICPGPELSGIEGVPDVQVSGTIATALAPTALLPAPTSGSGTLTLTSGADTLLEATSRTQSRSVRLPASGPVPVTGVGALAPGVAVTQEWLLDGKDLRGLASTPCAQGSSDQWLLAGGSGPGRLERLVLANPGANPVTADVTVHGAAGPIGEARVVSVPATGRVSLLLDALAPGEERPAVHVQADGGGLAATLTDTWTDGSTALGAETVAATSAAGTVQVLPGVLVEGPTSVRVAVPGEQDAVVRLTVLGPNGLVPLGGETVANVAAGTVGEVLVSGLTQGTYAVVVDSDVAVVAAAMSQVGDGPGPGEFSWTPSSDVIDTVGGAALPATTGVERTLSLTATGGASSAQVQTVVGDQVVTRRVDLLSERTAVVPLDGATSVWVQRITGSGALRGTLLSSSGTGPSRLISAMPLEASILASSVSRAFPLP